LSEASFLFTAVAIGYLVGSLLGGRLYDRMPGNPVMVASMVAIAATLVLTPFVPQIWILIVVIGVLGTAQGAVDVGGNTLLVWIHGRAVGPFMNGLHFFWGLGALISPLIVGQVILATGQIAWAFWALALMTVPVIILLLRLASPKARAEQPEQYSGNEDPAPSPGPISAQGNSVVLLVTLLLFLFVGAEGGFGGWIYSYALALDLGSTTTAAYLTSAYWGALTFGRLVAIPIASRARPRWILLADGIGCLASIGLLFVWPDSPSAAWISTIGMGLFMASVFPTAITLAERRIPITGRTTGWFLVGASMGGMTLPMLMGQLWEAAGPQSAMALLASYLALAIVALLSILFYSERRLSRRSSL
jgi:FHS family Na+ dependent glucose MFS transporter 1